MLRIFLRPKPATLRNFRSSSVLVVGGRAAARRPSASAAQWRLKFKHLTTLFYSSIIATAAAADAVAKQRRREQWTKVIQEAERSLAEVDTRTAVPSSIEARDCQGVSGHTADVRNLEDWIRTNTNTIPRTLFNFPFDLGDRRPRTKLKPRSTRTALPPSAMLQENAVGIPCIPESYRVSPSSIYASAFRRTMWRRQKKSSKKILTLELSIAKLTTRFLLYAARRPHQSHASLLEHIKNSDPTIAHIIAGGTIQTAPATATNGPKINNNAPTVHLDKDEVEERNENPCQTSDLPEALVDRLRQIETQLNNAKHIDAKNSGMLETVEYPQYALNHDEDSVHGLNYALVILTNKYGRGELSLEKTLAKISYNLLISRYAPTCYTYNILLSAFSRRQHHSLVEMILASFHESHVRPNEMIANTLLAHYTRKYDAAGFCRFAEKLQGLHGGPMLARGDVMIDGVGFSRLHERNGKVVQLLKFDPHMYRSIINGYLTFDDIDTGMMWYRHMLDDNIEPNIFLFTSFLRYFARQEDWDRAWGVWVNIERKSNAEHRQTGYIDMREMLPAYSAILELCERLGQREQHANILQTALAAGFSYASLKSRIPVARAFTRKRTMNKQEDPEFIRRNVRILSHRAGLMMEDLRAWAIHVLASKCLLRGLDLDSAYTVFLKFANDEAFEKWLHERPWLRKPRSLPLGASGSVRPCDGHCEEERRFQFGDA